MFLHNKREHFVCKATYLTRSSFFFLLFFVVADLMDIFLIVHASPWFIVRLAALLERFEYVIGFPVGEGKGDNRVSYCWLLKDDFHCTWSLP